MKSGFLNNAQMKKKKPSGAQKRKKKKEQEELVANVERLKLGPTPLWKFVVDHPDIFEAHVLLSGNLNGSDLKMFYEVCRASRRAVKRAKIKLEKMFLVQELSSISTMEMAWERYPWGQRVRWPDGKEFTLKRRHGDNVNIIMSSYISYVSYVFLLVCVNERISSRVAVITCGNISAW